MGDRTGRNVESDDVIRIGVGLHHELTVLILWVGPLRDLDVQFAVVILGVGRVPR